MVAAAGARDATLDYRLSTSWPPSRVEVETSPRANSYTAGIASSRPPHPTERIDSRLTDENFPPVNNSPAKARSDLAIAAARIKSVRVSERTSER